MNPIVWLSILLLLLDPSWAGETRYTSVIELPGGSKVQGYIHQPNKETEVEIFSAIKYAEAERFGKPKMITSWPGVYNATKTGNTCPQIELLPGLSMSFLSKLNESEDCLYLNIYRPVNTTKNSKLLPVMFWIYGGAFELGTIFTPIYDGTYMTSIGDVIVVAVNYRLGPLGFLYGGIEEAPGNQGIWDVLTGLKWVRANIKAFGGDPEQITVFGESAGSMITSALIMSPLSKGLFRRAIMQSGALISMITLDFRNISLIKTYSFVDKLNCSNEESDMKKSIECLRAKPWKEIIKAVDSSLYTVSNDMLMWPLFGADQLLPENVAGLQRLDADIDLMFGVVQNEGTMFVSGVFPFVEDEKFKFKDVHQLKQMIDDVNQIYYLDNYTEISDFYLKNINISDLNSTRDAVSDMFGDLRLTCPTILFGETLASKTMKNNNTIYSYRFDYRAKLNSFICKPWMKVCHASDIPFTFGLPLIIKAFGKKEIELSKQMMTAWSNFAKTGHPGKMGTIEWEEAFPNRSDPNKSPQMMSLNVDNKFRMLKNFFHERCNGLWKSKMIKH